jgi:hypothetical protein
VRLEITGARFERLNGERKPIFCGREVRKTPNASYACGERSRTPYGYDMHRAHAGYPWWHTVLNLAAHNTPCALGGAAALSPPGEGAHSRAMRRTTRTPRTASLWEGAGREADDLTAGEEAARAQPGPKHPGRPPSCRGAAAGGKASVVGGIGAAQTVGSAVLNCAALHWAAPN